ncbi:MAG: glycoside hydrolase family 97 C-terminal domain-containing protein, partial [Prevotella sp.]|nr:glycoside hydrolase family 97 C-terminal domain-containing protein [Prevotella sp.]
EWAIQFMKDVPTTWDETRFIDGYPGKYVIMARRHGDKWYVVGVTADKTPLKKKINFSEFTKQKKPAVLEAEDAIVFVSE